MLYSPSVSLVINSLTEISSLSLYPFVPEKKRLIYDMPSSKGSASVNLPIVEPVDSKVAKIEVQDTSGKRLATLSTVADIEALSMRNQKDHEGFRTLRVALAAKGGKKAANIDMRAWMSLPATLKAARIKVSKDTSKIKIVTFDSSGKRLASKVVKINKNSDNFIYARGVNNQLYTNTSKKLWL